MLAVPSCKPFRVRIDGMDYMRLRYGQEKRDGDIQIPDICHDCEVMIGGYHHPGCDMERCPKCGGQFMVCDCEVDDEVTREMVASSPNRIFKFKSKIS